MKKNPELQAQASQREKELARAKDAIAYYERQLQEAKQAVERIEADAKAAKHAKPDVHAPTGMKAQHP